MKNEQHDGPREVQEAEERSEKPTRTEHSGVPMSEWRNISEVNPFVVALIRAMAS